MQIAISELGIEIDGVLLSHRFKRSLLDRMLGAPSRLQAPLHIGGMTLQLAFHDDFGLTANIDLPSDLVVDLSIVLIASENTPRATVQPYDGELMMFGMNCRAPIQMNKTVIPRGLSARGSSLRWEGNGLDVLAFLKKERCVSDSQPRCFFEIVTIGFSLSAPAQGTNNAERQHRSMK